VPERRSLASPTERPDVLTYGIRTACIRMVAVVAGKYKYDEEEVQALSGALASRGPRFGHEYLGSFSVFSAPAGVRFTTTTASGATTPTSPDFVPMDACEITEEVEGGTGVPSPRTLRPLRTIHGGGDAGF